MEFVETIVIDAYLPTVSTIYSQEYSYFLVNQESEHNSNAVEQASFGAYSNHSTNTVNSYIKSTVT